LAGGYGTAELAETYIVWFCVIQGDDHHLCPARFDFGLGDRAGELPACLDRSRDFLRERAFAYGDPKSAHSRHSRNQTSVRSDLAWRFEPVYVNLQTLDFRIERARRQP